MAEPILMISQLTITNYILIEHLEIRFHAGLNIVTGETGAGKSILMGALSLLSGDRADLKSMRNPNEKCVVEAWFSGDFPELNAILTEAGIDTDPESILRREILPGGKSRAFINDTPVTLDVLKKTAFLLFDIHGQQDTMLLGNQDKQTETLDVLAGTIPDLKQYQSAYQAWKKAGKALHDLKEKREREASEFSYKQFVFNELEEARLQEGEQEQLESRLSLLKNSEDIKIKLNSALDVLEGETDLPAQLKSITQQLEKLSSFSASFQSLAERLKSTYHEIKDIASEIREEEASLNHDPEAILASEERLSQLYSLQKKHRKDTDAQLIAFRDQLSEELGGFASLDDEIQALETAYQQTESDMKRLADHLHAVRSKKTAGISKDLVALVQDMGIPNARFEVSLEPCAPSVSGADSVRFLFSANPGLPLADLKNAASGGEFSRLMLAFKCLMARSTSMPTLIFDEIDTGISGEVAMKVGRIMKEMAGRHQVLSITHSAQMASRADAHWFVYKNQEKDTTRTSVRLLSESEQLEEIAKMISGSKLTEASLQAAKELIHS